jgi:uncharacterized protein (TIGR00725 family)
MRTVVGVMGSGRPLDASAYETAHRLGALIAGHGWVLLTGGTASGVMDAASRGAHEAGGLVVGVLRGHDGAEASAYLDVGIRTGMGDARNVINVLSSDVVIALPGGPGTLSEIALALKSGKPVIVLGWDPGPAMRASGRGLLHHARTPEDAVKAARRALLGDV